MKKLILRTIVLIFILSATPFCAFAAGAGIFDNIDPHTIGKIIGIIIGAYIVNHFLGGKGLLARIMNKNKEEDEDENQSNSQQDSTEQDKNHTEAADQGDEVDKEYLKKLGKTVSDDKITTDADLIKSNPIMYVLSEAIKQEEADRMKQLSQGSQQDSTEHQEEINMTNTRKEDDNTDAKKQEEIDKINELIQGAMGYDTQTASWYRKHAEQGNAHAQNQLGVMYLYGLGVGKDYAEAMKWFRKSAEQGYMDAQFTMGIMYEKGLGVERDDTEAIKWYRKAADQGDSEAKEKLENLDAGIELEETESENRVPQKQNDASSSSVIPKRIIKIIGGIAIILIACYGIINTYYQSQREDYFEEGHFPGEDEPDFSKHIDVLTAMAEKGYEATKDTKEEFSSYEEEYEHYLKLNKRSGKSEYHIGTMYFLGRGISKGYFESYLDHKGGIRRKDYRKALIHYYRAIDWEFRAMNSDDCPPEAKLEMGYMYTHGVLVERDLDNAKKLLENVLASTPASSDYAKEAQKILGDSIYRAEFKKYLKDAQEGYSEALKEVGRCYASGIGVERNPDKAKEWFQKAAEREKQLEDIEVPDVIKDLMKDITKKCIDDIKSGRVR